MRENYSIQLINRPRPKEKDSWSRTSYSAPGQSVGIAVTGKKSAPLHHDVRCGNYLVTGGSSGAYVVDYTVITRQHSLPYFKKRAASGAFGEVGFEEQLAEAFKEREAMSALMANEWLGLRVLSLLTEGGTTATQIASKTERSLDTVAGTLARLTTARVLDTDGQIFRLTEKGEELIERIEERTGTSLRAVNISAEPFP
jgi:predicted transcriptional regulator